jgi:hypothetical protein
MDKLIKISKFFLIIFIFFVAIFIFAKNAFSDDKVVSFLENKFYSALHLKVDIDKVDISYKIIKIKNLKIFDAQNKEIGFVQEVDVKLSPWFFLNKKLNLKSVKFIKPKLTVVLKDFNNNINELRVDDKFAFFYKNFSKLNFNFKTLSFKFQIVDGEIFFKDDGNNSVNIELRKFNFTAENNFLGNKIEAKSDGNVSIKKIPVEWDKALVLQKLGLDNIQKCSYKIALDYGLKSKKINLKNLDIFSEENGNIANIKGKIFRDAKNFLKGDFYCYGNLQKSEIVLKLLKFVTTEEKDVADKLKINGSVGYKFALKINEANYLLSGKIDFTNSEILYSDKLRKKMNVDCLLNVDSILNFKEKIYRFKNIDFMLGNDTIICDGYFDSKNKKYEIKYKNFGDGLDFSNLRNIVCYFENDIKANLAGKLQIDGYLLSSEGKKIKTLKLKLDNIFYSDKLEKIEKINGKIVFDNSAVSVDNLNGLVDGKKFEMNFFISKLENTTSYFDLVLPVLNFENKKLKISKIVYLAGAFFSLFEKENIIDGKLKIENLKYQKFDFKNLNFESKYKEKKLDVKAGANFTSGKILGDFNFDLNQYFETKKTEDIFGKVALNLENINTDGVSSYFKQNYNLTGNLTGRLWFEILNKKIKNIECDCVLTNGKIIDFSFLMKLSKLAKDVNFQNFGFERFVVKLKFFDNILAIENADLVSILGQINLVGNVDFDKKLMDLILNSTIKGNKNRVDITGTFDQPKYKIYLANVIQNIGKNLLSGKFKLLQDLIK